MVLEVSNSGELILPPELVQAPPHSRLAVERQGANLVFKPLSNDVRAREPEQLTAAETWAGLLAWAARNRTPANIPLDTLRREDLYGGPEDGNRDRQIRVTRVSDLQPSQARQDKLKHVLRTTQ